MGRFITVGLTGGIATGKSTVAHRWQQAGAIIIDADNLAHQTFEPNTPTWAQIVQVFGSRILNPDRTINRRRLGEVVFENDQKRLTLNRIVHPVVRRMWTESLKKLKREGQKRVAVVSIPLLYEVGVEKQFDWVVAVGCSEQTQLTRLMAKGMSEPQARARIRAQWPLQMKTDQADFVIWNDGTLQVLAEQADIICAKFKESYHGASKN